MNKHIKTEETLKEALKKIGRGELEPHKLFIPDEIHKDGREYPVREKVKVNN